jgi:hypothetical protein
MDESLKPLLLVIGGDTLVERVYAELTATAGHQVRVAWPLDEKREAAFRSLGVTVAALDPRSDASLTAAGVMDADSLLALSEDDGLETRTFDRIVRRREPAAMLQQSFGRNDYSLPRRVALRIAGAEGTLRGERHEARQHDMCVYGVAVAARSMK